jgi:hypothetical protein
MNKQKVKIDRLIIYFGKINCQEKLLFTRGKSFLEEYIQLINHKNVGEIRSNLILLVITLLILSILISFVFLENFSLVKNTLFKNFE